jgi:hypothetical protein
MRQIKRDPIDYKHIPLSSDIEFISGRYTPLEEKIIDFKDRKVLYVIGNAILDNSCCGIGGCRYAIVPGFIIDFKYKKDAGLSVSKVEPIHDLKERQEIKTMINGRELVTQIDFW